MEIMYSITHSTCVFGYGLYGRQVWVSLRVWVGIHSCICFRLLCWRWLGSLVVLSEETWKVLVLFALAVFYSIHCWTRCAHSSLLQLTVEMVLFYVF